MMKSRTRGGNRCHARDRSAFWVSPPQRYVINRHEPTVVPHNLSVVLVTDPTMVEPAAFMCPISVAADALPDGSAIPSIFKVGVYVWNDTTLREILEEVLASSAVAKHLLLPSASITAPHSPSKMTTECGSNHAVEHGVYKKMEEESVRGSAKNDITNSNGDEVHMSEGNGSDADDPDDSGSLNDDEVAEGSCLKRGRMESNDNDKKEDEERQDIVQNSSKNWKHPRPSPVGKVRFYHVFADVGKKVHVESITVLRVDKPIFHGGDYTTMQELRTSMKGGRGWKNGDLLVLAPTVQRYKPAEPEGARGK